MARLGRQELTVTRAEEKGTGKAKAGEDELSRPGTALPSYEAKSMREPCSPMSAC